MIKSLELDCVEKLLFSDARIDRAELPLGEVAACYEFLREFAAEKVIYGINTGFGPMAQWRVDDRYLTDLQYNIIRSHSTGAGEPLPDLYVRAAMIARLGTLLQARSGIHPEVVDLLVEFINRGICPFIPEHGSVGASGDLVQLAHIALTLIGEGEVHYRGEWRPAAEVLRENGLAPMRIHIREGLSITNGTSVMTGIGLVNQFHAERLLDWATLASVMMNEIAASYDDFMAEGLNECRRHEGQQVIAAACGRSPKGAAACSAANTNSTAAFRPRSKPSTAAARSRPTTRCAAPRRFWGLSMRRCSRRAGCSRRSSTRPATTPLSIPSAATYSTAATSTATTSRSRRTR